jgi:hypothetical protein
VAKAVILACVAVAAGLMVYWLAGPKAPAPSRGTSAAPPSDSVGAGSTAAVPASGPPAAGPIEPPRTEQQKEHDALESRRAPLYGRLHQDLGAALKAVRPADDDPAALELYAAPGVQVDTLTLLSQALRDNASYYGFRHIRIYAPNPPGSIELYRLDAEANADSTGNWQTFKK